MIDSQRAAALPFTAARTQALLAALVVFHLLPHGLRGPRPARAPGTAARPAGRLHDRGTADLRPTTYACTG